MLGPLQSNDYRYSMAVLLHKDASPKMNWLDANVASEQLEEMVQVFMVVRCYSCKTFQVHQVKKTNKWVCKICTEKQSVIKMYGKGTGKDCRKYVQKLNMIQGEKEKERSGGGSHPPCDYARAFTVQSAQKKERQVEHPVVLAAGTKKSRWTTFTEPLKDEDEEEDESECTTDRNDFTSASKTRRKAKRSLSERKPSVQEQVDVCPYSSVNQEMEFPLKDHSKSMYFHHPDRYTKLDDTDTPISSNIEHASGHSHSMFDLSSSSPPASSSPGHHKEWMSKIKKDLEQFSSSSHEHHGRNDKESGSSPDKKIPKVSARWSQFMDESDEEDEQEVGGDKKSSGHILASKSTVAKYTL